jgi:thiosulfate reductase cytochrome b subunit
MATHGGGLRRGLPRRPGGDPWPPAASAPVVEHAAVPLPPVVERAQRDETSAPPVADLVPVAELVEASPAVASAPALRRGLPRTPGGEPWPPASTVGVGAAHAVGAQSVPTVREIASAAPVASTVEDAVTEDSPHATVDAAGLAPSDTARRGLPRTPGGEPWPPAGTVVRVAAVTAPETVASSVTVSDGDVIAAAAAPQSEGVEAATVPSLDVPAALAPTGPRASLALPRTAWAGRAAARPSAPASEPVRFGPFTKVQWLGAAAVGGVALLFVAAMAVAFVRFFLSLPFMQDFLVAFPGEYHLPEGAPVGIPAWLGWQHFFNVFLMVLIIRSGLQVRTEKRPAVFWTPRKNKKGKISLTLWFHQSLDILWLVNGVVFVVLLFVTGQWMRIIPTSWEVFPNALSAALQYVSLDWPTENGWVNYNSLQQLAYFSTVFVAAPLAAITGYRMSGLWPKKAANLNRLYPVEWARAVHFPVMLYFVAFIFVHVALVFATGALRNLNHMYAAQGSVDGIAYADNWTGFWMFFASLVVIAGAWVAARPLVLAPIARLFGNVSGR